MTKKEGRGGWKKIVPDTSILVNGELSALVREGKLDNVRLMIPKTVVDELQSQASTGRDIGFEGLEEIKELREQAKKGRISLEFVGKRPTMEEIQLAKKGRLDAIIRDVAAKQNARLLTADYVQALVAEAEGVEVEHIPKIPKKKTRLEEFFDEHTQSVHLKIGVSPTAKKGLPGDVTLVTVSEEPLTEEGLKDIIEEIILKTRVEGGFTELVGRGATVLQMGDYRISIAKPPFSDGLELTAVRPIAKVTLDDYKLHEELKTRLSSTSQGVLISGPPGSGKSSFASAVAEYLCKKGKIVKTFEQPRDLQVGPEITQYAPLDGSWAKTADILLLVRPDYTIFDEIRQTNDFRVFSDMRLAGVGMIGVIHSTNPVAAIQRFIGRIELGIIPHVIDTVVYIQGGKIEKVYELSLTVKIPTGMKEADLARPVVEIRDFATKNMEYEIYTFGEENVIIPVKSGKASPIHKLAKEKILEELRRFDPQAEIDILAEDRIIARVRNNVIARLIGKGGENIERIEERLGLGISVEPKEQTLKDEVQWRYEESHAYLNIIVPERFVGKQVDIHAGDEYLFSPHVGGKGIVKVRKKTEFGRKTLQAIVSKKLRVFA